MAFRNPRKRRVVIYPRRRYLWVSYETFAVRRYGADRAGIDSRRRASVRAVEQDQSGGKRLLYHAERLPRLGAARDRFDWSCNCECCACIAHTRTARALVLRANQRALSCRHACDLFCFHLSRQPGDKQLDPGPNRLGTTALAMGVVTRRECGDHLFRILLANRLIAVDAEVGAGATYRSAHAT